MLLHTEQKCIVEFLNSRQRENGGIMYIDTFNFNLSLIYYDYNTLFITRSLARRLARSLVRSPARSFARSLAHSHIAFTAS